MTVRVVNCPQCGKPARWDPTNSFRPFCSERCRLIDLGAWANENYRIPVSDPVEESEQDIPADDRPLN
jgi:uncharacterized protein